MTVKAKKHLGQHFLKDENIAKRIADSLKAENYNKVLEIGPGMGVLTKYLLDRKNLDVNVVEIDKESVAYLQSYFSLLRNKIFSEDFLKMDLTSLFKKEQFGIIGNFPYNISTQIVFKTLENKALIPEFSGMFQKEVAERIAEKEGSKKYGILSVLTQAFYEVEYLFTVPPNVFNPPPKVDSGVIRLTRKENFTLPVNEKLFYTVVKTAFNQRRKMLRVSLKSLGISDNLKQKEFLKQRPEQLSVSAFIQLTKWIEKEKSIS
ncbi:MAG TPA: 16S rRNA (adenine(1518)-N(6)/adenine(1519)-N(6))-dimethyltransferase RsmA [Flavobacteriia bacterium]|nr:16S rRNA (adenine(1518)-N(6)/adenine(1519)-N(6))-dimethyltransferase RsmA [Flavobacteriia bacterium]